MKQGSYLIDLVRMFGIAETLIYWTIQRWTIVKVEMSLQSNSYSFHKIAQHFDKAIAIGDNNNNNNQNNGNGNT